MYSFICITANLVFCMDANLASLCMLALSLIECLTMCFCAMHLRHCLCLHAAMSMLKQIQYIINSPVMILIIGGSECFTFFTKIFSCIYGEKNYCKGLTCRNMHSQSNIHTHRSRSKCPHICRKLNCITITFRCSWYTMKKNTGTPTCHCTFLVMCVFKTLMEMEDIDGGLHPAVDGQSLD